MTDDPYGALDQPTDAGAEVTPRPVAQPQPSAPPEPEPLGYQYQDANTDYAYGPPQQNNGAYGVPFYGQQPQPYAPMVQQPFYGRPLLEDLSAPDAPLRGANLVESYKRFWTRGLTFSGRASLAEYWWVFLIHAVGFAGFSMLSSAFEGGALGGLLGTVGVLYILAAVVPGIALGTRRLHDTDNSGLLQLINLVPWLGSIVMIILMAQGPKDAGKRYDKINQR